MKINKNNLGWIFACFGLSICLIGSLYLGLSGWFYKNTVNYATEFKIGNMQILGLKDNQSNALSLNFEGSFICDEDFPQIVNVKNVSDKDFYLRGKVFINSKNNVAEEIKVETTTNWIYDDDSRYYYFNNKLIASGTIAFCSKIKLDKDIRLNSNKKYIITFVFESLENEENVTNIWNWNVE